MKSRKIRCYNIEFMTSSYDSIAPDLTKAFDTVNRQLLWQILSRFGCPPNFLAVLQEFHSNMKAKVAVGGQLLVPFDVLVGVKPGCVLAPVIFNLFLVAVTLASRDGFPSDAGVPFIHRLDGSLFNIRRLKADTKVSRDRIFELQAVCVSVLLYGYEG